MFDMRRQLDAYRIAVNADPTQAISYKVLGFTLMRWRKFEEAVSAWKSLQRISPEDKAGRSMLSRDLPGDDDGDE